MFLIIKDDGSEYIQETEDAYDFYDLECDRYLVAGNDYGGAKYKALIKLTEEV